MSSLHPFQKSDGSTLEVSAEQDARRTARGIQLRTKRKDGGGGGSDDAPPGDGGGGGETAPKRQKGGLGKHNGGRKNGNTGGGHPGSGRGEGGRGSGAPKDDRKKSGEQHASGLDIHAPPKTDGSLPAAAASGGQSGGVAPAASFARAETPTQVHAVRSAATKSQLASAPFQRTGGGGAPPKATPGTKKKTPLRAPTSKPTKPYELEDVVICGECCEECMTCEQPVVNTASIFTNRVTVILSPLQEDASEALGRRARVVSTVAMLDTGANESNFISRALANELVSLGGEICLSSDRVVCSAFIRQSLCKY